jgi:hypothetical protein
MLQGKIDGINRRMDAEVESRSKLADRLSKVEERLKEFQMLSREDPRSSSS